MPCQPSPCADIAMPPKGKGGNKSADYILGGKGYQAALQDVFKATAVKASDIDPKAVQLLDALQIAGKADEACAHLSKSLEGVAREKVENWKAYVFTLLRSFDTVTYNAMKEQRGRPRPRRSDKEKVVGDFSFRAEAVEFVPGQIAWTGMGDAAATPQAPPAPAPAAPAAAAEASAVPSAAEESSEGVVFQVEYSGTEKGEVVAVTGGAPELGSWDTGKTLVLTTSKASSSVWKSSPVPLANGTELEYKFVVLGPDKAVARWEPIEGNRKLKAGTDPGVMKFGSL